MTGEMLSPSSAARQLSDQITMAKALLVIAKESNNFNFAWELSAKIRTCQLLLSESTSQGTTISAKEAAPVIKEMSVLFSKAQDLHYDSATMIMKLKAQIQVCST
jgi:alpha-1,4-galacturonosyltransferase